MIFAGRKGSGRWAKEAGRLAAAAALAAAAGWTSACTTNPATGEPIFTALMPAGQEAQIGEETHPQILEQFGGAYDDPELQRYVQSIGELVAATSERQDVDYTFTLLNSDITNAFAVPGGYIYITRGLLALANDEAEVAGVLAHEVGHIVARHSAQRASQSALAGLATAVLGAATGSAEVARLAQFGGLAVIQSYSREQEFESDTLGVRYLARAGYDPTAMSTFLASLQAESELQSRITGKSPEFNIMSTHPRTQDRVERAVAAAAPTAVPEPMRARDIYLDKIDGMLYGDSPEQGYVRGRDFIHPVLGFRFRVPEGFRLLNGARQVVAQGPDDALIVFDAGERSAGQSIAAYLRDDWLAGAPLQEFEQITVNGLPAATARLRGTVQGTVRDIRGVAIAFDDRRVYRFLFVTPAQVTARFTADFQRTTFSFERLSAAEAARYKPLRLQVVEVQPGDTTATFARRMAVAELPEEHFRLLNDLEPGERLDPGQRVKIVAD